MQRRLIEAQPDGIVEWFHFDELTGEMAIERVQDVEPVLEANKRAQTGGDGFSPSRELREVAEIPLGIVELWRTVLGVDIFNRDHWPRVKQLLRDADWRHLRTSPGAI
ncbi:MAG TPA: hypothetical protein VN710_07905 [Verrucomicrobiae bacterium]|nr:hypothetical protein [Verrucomicrobiae bacterium]